MRILIEVILIVWSFVVAIIAILYTINSQIRQRRFFEGRKYRQQGAAFVANGSYVYENAIKKLIWLKQKNGGTTPEDYPKNITFVSHFDNVNPIIKGSK